MQKGIIDAGVTLATASLAADTLHRVGKVGSQPRKRKTRGKAAKRSPVREKR